MSLTHEVVDADIGERVVDALEVDPSFCITVVYEGVYTRFHIIVGPTETKLRHKLHI